ncbi:Transcription factor CP2-like protein 1 [Lasiodiplodia theobromae]|uniref:Transcription factor CP2-like protein 1 n=1 Tax=Lasiodiplodia theobromae TaxID=45133 RepID=UPI0015C3485E|nr:Transcription factor CP2-like protein 1 [Lasiodiplodia theobromae]KAF4542680.1 Transcription factor CP2-like protein 1 [Lasiodiplodia theobromae]
MAAPTQNEQLQQDAQPQQYAQSHQNAQPSSSAPPNNRPKPEHIQINVIFCVAKENEKMQYTETFHVPLPDKLETFRAGMRAVSRRVQAGQGEEWSWVSPDLSVVWTDMPSAIAVMDSDNWTRNLRFMHERKMGDYIRIDMKYERKAPG